MTRRVPFRTRISGALPFLVCAAPLLLVACAQDGFRRSETPPRLAAADVQTVECARLFVRLDRETAAANVADGQEARIDGFPHLRVNRFLAADWRPMPEDDGFVLWVERLRRLDHNARRFEIRNLPSEQRARIAGDGSLVPEILQRLSHCSEILMARDLGDPDARAWLYRTVSVPDDYRLLYRAAGIYPLSSIPFYAGIKRLHDDISRDFRVPLDALPQAGRLMRYRPDAAQVVGPAGVAAILRRAADNPLRMPLPSAEDRARLFQAFAPIFEIDVAEDEDRIGWPYWRGLALPSVDTSRPVVFTYLSHVRFEANTLLQLNYVVWFPARPANGSLDILAGRLDGINWRVTLDADGRPLLYDSMHNCGCYHLFIPGGRLKFRAEQNSFDEPVLIPQKLRWSPGRVVLRIASRTHYLQRAFFDRADSGERYPLADYDSLRSLTYGNRRRSLFRPDGLVPGTERLERFIFWPMGIESPGAMRQRGRHATAFIGRRHFDDPGLVSRYFRRDRP